MIKSMKSLPFAIAAISILACRFTGGDEKPSAEELARTMVAMTSSAEAALNPSTQTPSPPLPSDTPEPTATKTSTPLPSPTSTPGPVIVVDDFSQDRDQWLDCDECNIRDGTLFMGPWGISGAEIPHFAYCYECGWVTNYRMAVDISFEEGRASRGFGFLVQDTEDYFITAEITTFQEVNVWKYYYDSGEWEWIKGLWTGAARPGYQTNRLEVEVADDGNGKSTISVSVNGKSVIVVFGQPAQETVVGFTLYGHAMTGKFDNFEFESREPYGEPIELFNDFNSS